MSAIYMDVDAAITVPVNVCPLRDDTDFKTLETSVAYNAAGMTLIWHFVSTAGVVTSTAVTPTTAGVYDWSHVSGAMYKCEIPASGGASANNDTEGFGYFTGSATGVLPWRGPTICFRAAALNNLLIDDAFSTTRGLAGTALPNAAAEAAGGLFTRGTGAGQINQDANGRIDVRVYSFLASAITAAAFNANALVAATFATDYFAAIRSALGLATNNLDTQLAAKLSTTDFNTAISGLNLAVSRRYRLSVLDSFEVPDSGSSTYTIELETFDEETAAPGAADSSPSLTATGIVSGSLAANLSSVSNPSTGRYRWTYTLASSATMEQIRFDASVVLDGVTFTPYAATQVTNAVSVDFTATDRTNLASILSAAQAAETASESADGKLTAPRLAKVDNLLASGTYSTLAPGDLPSEPDNQGIADALAAAEALADPLDELHQTLVSPGVFSTPSLVNAPSGGGGGGGGTATIEKQEEIIATQAEHTATLAALSLGGGTGSEPITLSVEDESGSPIEGLRIDLRDVSGNRAGYGVSIADGTVPDIGDFNPATYTPHAAVSGLWRVVAGQSFVVTSGGANEFVVVMEALTITAPPAGTATGWIRTRNAEQVLTAGETVSVVAIRPPGENATGGTGDAPSNETWTVTSALVGGVAMAQFPGMLLGWTYKVWGDAIGISEDEGATFKVPATALDSRFAIRSFIRKVES